MADQENGNGAASNAQQDGDAQAEGDITVGGGETPAPQAGILSQYIKDLSFENPNAPQSFQNLSGGKPQIDVNVNVNGRKLNDETYEVELKLQASAKDQNGNNAFVVELLYAGLFGLRNVPDEVVQPFMLVQAPTILFPFARRIIADATRDGGYPPLLLDPIDFAGLYQNQMAQGGQQASSSTTPPPPPPPPQTN